MPAVLPHWMRLPPYTVNRVLARQRITERIPWQVADYGIDKRWAETTGAGVRVGVIDTGIDETHADSGDLCGAVVASKDFTGSRWGATDRNGHGTHCAGIIGGRRGIWPGSAPECLLVIAKGMGDDGAGTTDIQALALEWCAGQGCRVVNMSQGGPDADPRLEAAIQSVTAAGVIVVCAAGNESGAVDFPARCNSAIAVSAVDKMRRLAPFSCRGPEVDCGAPGVDITATWINGAYASCSGTSMAAPFVAGLIALYLATPQGKEAKLADVLNVLKRAAKDVGPKGRDDYYGYGLPDGTLLEPPAKDAPPAPTIGKTIRVRFPGGGEVLLSGGELVG